MRLIILAAGQGFQLDGFNKILLKNPSSGKTILDNYLSFFAEYNITIVVGFNAITIMNEYPNLNYIYNSQWRVKSNSYSLALALNHEPCIILPSDFFFDEGFAEIIKSAPDNSGLVINSENRSTQALHCTIHNNKLSAVYKGKAEPGDPELMGVFKICDKEILKKWKQNCLANDTASAFIGENLPFRNFDIDVFHKGNRELFEINTPTDYLNFITLKRNSI